jgi:hypothetical protein
MDAQQMMNEQQHKNYDKQQRRMVVKSNFIPKVSNNVREQLIFTQSVINQPPKIPKPISSMQNQMIATPSSNTVHDQAITHSSLSSMQSYIGKPPKRNQSPPVGVQAGLG